MTRYDMNLIKSALTEKIKEIKFPGSNIAFRYIPISAIDDLDKIDFEEDITGKTVVADGITMDDIITILSDGLAAENAFCAVDYNEDEYFEAKEMLLNEGWVREQLTIELVQAKMLMMGHSIMLIESESKVKHALTLQKLVDAINKIAADLMHKWKCTKIHAISEMLDKGDFYDYEGILQTAIFNEVIYG